MGKYLDMLYLFDQVEWANLAFGLGDAIKFDLAKVSTNKVINKQRRQTASKRYADNRLDSKPHFLTVTR